MRCLAPGLWPWPQGLHRAGRDCWTPAGSAFPGPKWFCPVISHELSAALSGARPFQGSSLRSPQDCYRMWFGSCSLPHQLTAGPQDPTPTALLPLSHPFTTSLAPDNPADLKKGQSSKGVGGGYLWQWGTGLDLGAGGTSAYCKRQVTS